MSRSLTRKDFLIFSAASAGTAFVAAACSSDNPSSGGGAGAGPGPGGSTGSGGANPGTAGASAGTTSAGAPSAGAPGGGASNVAGTGAGGSPAGGTGAGGTGGGSSGAGGTPASAGAGAGGKGGAGGSVSAGAGGGGGVMCTADVVAKISCPHDPPHTLTIAKADIDAAVANKMFTLSMAAGHTHVIMMTAADWTTLKNGGTVFKYVDAGTNQDHCVVLSCGTVNAATAAGAMCGGTATGTDNAVTCTTPWP
ncbi:MAG: hypothetical protein WDO69_13330 [Pseudomonadota bacterium]